MSKRKVKVIDGVEIHEGSGNVYADLGYLNAAEMQIGGAGRQRNSALVSIFGLLRFFLIVERESKQAGNPSVVGMRRLLTSDLHLHAGDLYRQIMRF